MNEGDLLAVLIGLVDVVGGEDDGGAGLVRFVEAGPEGGLGVGV